MIKGMTFEQELADSLFMIELEERLELVQAVLDSSCEGPLVSCCLDN